MNINKDYISNNNSYANNNPLYIVIHNTDNYSKTADAKAHAKAQHDGNFKGYSAHLFVDDKSAYQATPYNRGCWHVGVNYGSNNLFSKCKNTSSVGIEMCVNAGYDYEKAFQNTVEVTKQLMKELNIDADHVVTHYDVCTKNCPSAIRAKGDWDRFKKLIKTNLKTETKTGLQASELNGLKPEQVIKKVGKLFTEDEKKTGVLACVSLAQFILESGWGQSQLIQRANNGFGMKENLSGNTWKGSTWKGDVINMITGEETKDGKKYKINATFRKYDSLSDSIEDHSAYLLGAKNGRALRYKGLKGCKDYKKAAQIIKDGGYATSSSYVSSLCSLIERYSLNAYNKEASQTVTPAEAEKQPFKVKVTSDYLRIRKEPNLNGDILGYTGQGIFTIVEEKNGWGRLKSGAGWICISIDCVKRI